jgi:hypothetical protein
MGSGHMRQLEDSPATNPRGQYPPRPHSTGCLVASPRSPPSGMPREAARPGGTPAGAESPGGAPHPAGMQASARGDPPAGRRTLQVLTRHSPGAQAGARRPLSPRLLAPASRRGALVRDPMAHTLSSGSPMRRLGSLLQEVGGLVGVTEHIMGQGGEPHARSNRVDVDVAAWTIHNDAPGCPSRASAEAATKGSRWYNPRRRSACLGGTWRRF